MGHRVLEDANLSAKLHHIACNFKKFPGKTYYVYKKQETGKEYMSMISPAEWGAACPPFVAGYRLARHELDSRRQNGGEEQRQRNDRENLEGQRSRVQTSVNIWQLIDLTILQSPFIINLHGTVD